MLLMSYILGRRMVSRDSGRAGLQVLLVDDNDAFLAAATLFLQELPGIGSVLLARSGTEAIAFAADHRPDFVLMDYQMPGPNGIEALAAIKSQPGAPRIVIMTLHDPALLAGPALAAGADAFVPKDQLFGQLPVVIERLFGPQAPTG